jgi:hypothetical protein
MDRSCGERSCAVEIPRAPSLEMPPEIEERARPLAVGRKPDYLAWFKKVSGTVVRSTHRAVPATVPDTFLNQADFSGQSHRLSGETDLNEDRWLRIKRIGRIVRTDSLSEIGREGARQQGA